MDQKLVLVIFCFTLYIIFNPINSFEDGYLRDFKMSRKYYNTKAAPYQTSDKEGLQILCQEFGICRNIPQSRSHNQKLKTVIAWKQLDFDYLTESDRQNDIYNKIFIPGIPAPIDVDVYYKFDARKIVFVTVPRFQLGVPATFGTVVASKRTRDLVIKPYPSWSWHRDPESCNDNRIVSVYRVKVDNCGRLWILDTGRYLANQVCPMQILAFDLKTDALIHRHVIKDQLLIPASILVTLVVDVQNKYCDDTFVYIADTQAFSIIVHEMKRNISWKVTDKTMYPFPTSGTFKIQGEQFDLMDGVLGMDITPNSFGRNQKLFYHALSSATENWVYTAILRNQSLFDENPAAHPELFNAFNGVRQSQSAAEAIDNNGIAFFGQMTETSLNCWNVNTEYGLQTIDVVEYNPITLQFASGIKVINNPKGHQELWILTSRLQKVFTGSLNPYEINFRIQVVNTEDAVIGTKCKKEQKG